MGAFIARRFPKHARWNDDDTALLKPDGSELVVLTAAQVQAVAKKYFGDDQLTVATLLPQPRDPNWRPRKPPAGARLEDMH